MSSTVSRSRRISLLSLSFLALIVGIVTGVGAVLFRALVSLVHNVAFYGEFSMVHDANQFGPPSSWGPFIILVPVIGGMGVVFLVRNFAPEAKGHGVPEVMSAIYSKQGVIRPAVVFVKSIASALSIGTGAAVGREGPIIQIGSALGSSFAQFMHLPTAQRITLLGAGAGAGIAATFNTPLGAVLFAVELMIPEVSTSTFLPVVIATGTAAYVGRLFFGDVPAFAVPLVDLPPSAPVGVDGLLAFVVLGSLCGAAAVLFVRSLVFSEDLFKALPVNDYVRHAIGMLLMGAMMYGFLLFAGHYYVEGVGYATIQAVLLGGLVSAPLLLLLFFAKVLATSISLGSGSSGGIFAPSLFMGTTLGGAFGGLILMVMPESGVQPADFAMVGMAAVVAAGTGAAMTAIVMVFEMTRDYNLMIPMIMAVAVAVGTRRLLSKETIYTIKLARRGEYFPQERHSNMFMVRPAREVMDANMVVIPGEVSLAEAVALLPGNVEGHSALITAGERIVGMIPNAGAIYRYAAKIPDHPVRAVAHRRIVVAQQDAGLNEVLKRMHRRRASAAVVVSKRRGIPRVGDAVGLIAKHHVADSVLAGMETYLD